MPISLHDALNGAAAHWDQAKLILTAAFFAAIPHNKVGEQLLSVTPHPCDHEFDEVPTQPMVYEITGSNR